MNLAKPQTFAELVGYVPPAVTELEVHGTTVLCLKYKGGVLTMADRRATMGNLIMYDRAEKIFALDESTVIAVSGAFARSVEICRMLKHSFKYYRRMYMQPMSVEGKLQEISRALSQNLSMAMSGVGVFLPIVSTYDPKHKQFGVYSFDTAGARFELSDFAAAGSGSERIRGIFDYISETKGPWHERSRDEVLRDGMDLLRIAADLDSATGGMVKEMPLVRDLSSTDNEQLSDDVLKKIISSKE